LRAYLIAGLDMGNFFAKLKPRHIYPVGAAYRAAELGFEGASRRR